jgi:hypothetical protein
MRRCSIDCARILPEVVANGMDSMQMDSLRIWVQRLAEDAVLPKPCMGWR